MGAAFFYGVAGILKVSKASSPVPEQSRDNDPQRRSSAPGFLARIGPLRIALSVFVLACLPLAPFTQEGHEGWRVIPVYIAPVMVIIFIWLLLFDMLMTRIMLAGKPPEEHPRYRTAFRLDVTLLLALLLFWGPFYYGLLSG